MGVARQYCGRLGKVPGGDVPGLCPRWDGHWWIIPHKDRCEAAGVPEDRQGYRSKTELALEMVGRAQERGHKAGLGTPLGFSVLGPGGLGDGTCWTFRPALRCGRRSLPVRSIRDRTQGAQLSSAATSCRRRPGVNYTCGRGKPGTTQLPFQRPEGATDQQAQARRNPLRAGTGTAANPATCPSAGYPVETLAYVGGSRWRIETEFETEKSDVGLDPAPGLAGITTWPCACWAELFC